MTPTKCIKENNLNRKIIFLLGSLYVLFSSFSYSQVQGISFPVGKVVTGDAATAYTVPYTITPADTVGSTFKDNGTGGGTITLASGKTIEVASLPSTVQDAAGTIYQADDKGKLTKVGSNSSNAGTMLATANLTVVDASKGTVTFAPTSDMKYAFDAWQKAYDGNNAWSKRYETLPISGQSVKYRVSSKLMVPGEADKVLAIINLNDKKLVADSVRFVNAKGTVFEKDSITPTSYKINLVGGPAGDAQEVYALYSTGGKTYTLGKLLVATYEPKTINLALVPVNGAKLDSEAIVAELKKVYEPLGIDFNLTTKDKFEYEALETASLKVEGSGLLSVYTDQMKALNSAYVDSLGGAYDAGTVYMFALKQGAGKDEGKTILGDMPRGKQFGYIFTQGQDGTSQGATAAHEIGHGIFQLQHTFSYSGMADATFSAANMMNYPAGEALSKLQWDLMHDPGLVISVFETDKGAELTTGTNEYYGFSPNGDVIDISKLKHKINSLDPKNTNYVYAMSVDGKTNTYTWDSNKKGYKFQNDSVEKPYLETVTQDIKVAIWLHQTDSCYALYKFIPVDKGYIPKTFKTLETQRINNADYSKGWIIHEANKLNAECKQKAEAAIVLLANKSSYDCTQNYKIEVPGSVANRVNSHSQCLANLSDDDRWTMLGSLINDLGGGIAKVEGEFDSDDAVCRLLCSVSDEKKVTFYDKLKTEKTAKNTTYFSEIVSTMDEEDLVVFSKWMTNCIFLKKIYSATAVDKDQNTPTFVYKSDDSQEPFKGIQFFIDFERKDGKLIITQKRLDLIGSFPKTDYSSVSVDADGMVKLRFYSDLKYGLETIYAKDSTIALPALALWCIMEKKKERDLQLTVKGGFVVLSLVATGGGGTAAAWNFVDALALSSNILIEDAGWKNKITSSTGKKCLSAYETLVNLYFAGRALEAVGAFDGLKTSYKEWKATATNAEEVTAVEGKIGKIVESNIKTELISTIDDLWKKIPIGFRKQVQDAFDAGSVTLKYADDNLILYRHISKDGPEKSFWYARTLESPSNARKLFALPNDNAADWIVKVKVKKGTPYVEGRVASQVGNKNFGSYATGEGNQLYFLQENMTDIEIIGEKFINPIK